ncbi:MAG: hypothetical protein D6801_09920, partial [Alphaproteobacteria bacterium]
MTAAGAAAGETAEFTFRPAPASAPVRFRLDGARLARDGAWRLDFGAITGASFTNHSLRGMRLIRLDLFGPEGRRSIGFTRPRRNWRADPEAEVFLSLLIAVLEAAGRDSPGLEITLGERGWPRAVMFALGLVAGLGGAGLFAAALASGASGERLAAAAVPMLMLVMLGAALTMAYGPWRKARTASPGALADVLRGVRDGLAGQGPPKFRSLAGRERLRRH